MAAAASTDKPEDKCFVIEDLLQMRPGSAALSHSFLAAWARSLPSRGDSCSRLFEPPLPRIMLHTAS